MERPKRCAKGGLFGLNWRGAAESADLWLAAVCWAGGGSLLCQLSLSQQKRHHLRRSCNALFLLWSLSGRGAHHANARLGFVTFGLILNWICQVPIARICLIVGMGDGDGVERLGLCRAG